MFIAVKIIIYSFHLKQSVINFKQYIATARNNTSILSILHCSKLEPSSGHHNLLSGSII
jgi:hypothetical protein